MPRGSNLGRVSSFNQAVVLDLVRRSDRGLSRVELAESTGLSAQTVSNIARRLLNLGLITETGKVWGPQGKPRTVLNIDPASRYAVGVHLDPSVLTFVLLDLAGAVAARSHLPVQAVANPAETVSMMASAVQSLIREVGVPPEKVLGVGIASPGPIDYTKGLVVGPPLLTGWDRVDLRESLSEATGFRVFLDKDSTAAAHGELWISDDRTAQNFAFIYMGTGIGAGLAVNGEVARGASNNVGEIGHLSTGADAPVCECGRNGCVGLATMPAYLVSEATAAGLLQRPFDSEDLQATAHEFRRLGRLADQGDEKAAAILDTAAERLARAVEDIVNLLDVNQVVFGGPSWSPVASRYLRGIRAALANRLAVGRIHEVQLADTALGEDVAAVGAACIVLDHVLSPRTGGLLLAG